MVIYAILTLYTLAHWRREAACAELHRLGDYIRHWHPADGSTLDECEASLDRIWREGKRWAACQLTLAGLLCAWIASGAWL